MTPLPYRRWAEFWEAIERDRQTNRAAETGPQVERG